MRAPLLLLLLVACSDPAPRAPVVEPTPEPAPAPEAAPPDRIAVRGPTPEPSELFAAMAVTLGRGMGCALARGGRVRCWGDDAIRSGAPTEPLTAIAASDTRVCGLSSEGHPICWGPDDGADLVPPPRRPLAHLAAARTFHCGLDADGRIHCWGNADSRRLEVPARARFTALALHDPTSAGLTSDGRVLVWGLGPTLLPGHFTDVASAAGLACGLSDGEIECTGYRAGTTPPTGPFVRFAPTRSIGGGGGICALRGDGSVACFGFDDVLRVPPAPSGAFTDVAVGRTFACGLRSDRTIACWGAIGEPPEGTFTALVAGEGQACAIDDATVLRCWGTPFHGQADPPPGRFASVSAGELHTCAIDEAGAIHCWGEGAAEPPPGAFAAVVSGDRRACAIDAEGRVLCWGAPARGGPPDAPVRALSMHGYVECAVLSGGDVRCWGDATRGLELADVHDATDVRVGGDVVLVLGATNRLFRRDVAPGGGGGPEPVFQAQPLGSLATLEGELDVGGDAICGLSSGTIRCVRGDRVLTVDGGPYRAFDLGEAYGCALHEDGSLACWGQSPHGEAHPPSGHYVSLDVGAHHACAIRDDGALACWGDAAGTPL